MECHYCKKIFNNKYTLGQHQKTAKYCLELQGTTNTSFTCSYCNKNLCTNDKLYTHYQSCKEKLKHEIVKNVEIENEYLKKTIQEKTDYITKLEAKLEKFEDAVMTNMAATTNALEATLHMEKEEEDEDNTSPIPLGEQMSSIVIDDVKEEEVEYSNIILNNVVITSRPLDHYVNATQLCQAGGKKFSHWFSLETTKELINELSSDAGIPASLLVETVRGRSSKFTQGSWIHPDLSIQLAQWISPKFAIQVSKWIRTLFNDGSIEIDLSLMREKEVEMREKDNRIKRLESVCLSKQRRVVYPERNVIYMLTTDDHLRRRTYIIGKAKNLTNRLSTYNKTCDHTVIHYRECKNEDDMDTVETMVLSKLRSHREQANRDRFILPDDKDESFFIGTIDECVRFLE